MHAAGHGRHGSERGAKAPHDQTPRTAGITLHRPRLYDLFVPVATLGRARAIRARTVALAGLQPGDRVLDVGCGTGDLTVAAAHRVGATSRVVGIDASPEMIGAARRKAARAGVEVEFRVGLVEALEFPDGHFDAVLSSLMVHHLPSELKRRGFIEMHRVLRPGGRVLIVDFKRPTSRTARLLMVPLAHAALGTGVQDLGPLLTETGFTKIEAGDVGFGPIGAVRGYAS
jgi:ubiquinone/menaquinone biosynthesis C-methylase UbiE